MIATHGMRSAAEERAAAWADDLAAIDEQAARPLGETALINLPDTGAAVGIDRIAFELDRSIDQSATQAGLLRMLCHAVTPSAEAASMRETPDMPEAGLKLTVGIRDLFEATLGRVCIAQLAYSEIFAGEAALLRTEAAAIEAPILADPVDKAQYIGEIHERQMRRTLVKHHDELAQAVLDKQTRVQLQLERAMQMPRHGGLNAQIAWLRAQTDSRPTVPDGMRPSVSERELLDVHSRIDALEEFSNFAPPEHLRRTYAASCDSLRRAFRGNTAKLCYAQGVEDITRLPESIFSGAACEATSAVLHSVQGPPLLPLGKLVDGAHSDRVLLRASRNLSAGLGGKSHCDDLPTADAMADARMANADDVFAKNYRDKRRDLRKQFISELAMLHIDEIADKLDLSNTQRVLVAKLDKLYARKHDQGASAD